MPTSRVSKEPATVTSHRATSSPTVGPAAITSAPWLRQQEGEGLGKNGVPTSLGFGLTTAAADSSAGHAFAWADKIQTLLTPCWITPGRIPASQSNLAR